MYPYLYSEEWISTANTKDFPNDKQRAEVKKNILKTIADMDKEGNSNDEIIRRSILKTAKIF